MKRGIQVPVTSLPLEIPSDSKEMIKERWELKLFLNTSKKISYYVLKNLNVKHFFFNEEPWV